MNIQQFIQWLSASKRPTLVMGVLNVTPDSFSDGGRYATIDAAAQEATSMIADGADLIDIGGESTRPGSDPVDADEQIRRVVPVIRAIRDRRLDVVLSVDTTSAKAAAAALEAGGQIINDISAGQADDQMLSLAAQAAAPIILMHMQGTPKTMQERPSYENVALDVEHFLRQRIEVAVSAGVKRERILIDPGIGFGKTTEHNLTLLREQRGLCRLGRPVVIGTSRKGFVGKITNEPDPARRLFGTAATVAWAVTNGAGIVRVHDVGPMAQVVRMTRAITDPNADFLTP